MVRRDREERYFEPLASVLPGLDRKPEALDGLFRPLARLVGDRAAAIAVDVAVRVKATDDVVAALPEDAARRSAEQFLALLVPEDDPIRRVDGENGLATAGDGTALAIIFAAARENPSLQVYADETRPLLQGARLTTWELMQREVSVTLICDSMAGWVMKESRVQAVIVGADRIAANGDSANKIGTYSLSVLARAHNIPFYVAAPSSTFDLTIPDGSHIPIEERSSTEITHAFGKQTAPDGCRTYNPAFDVAPASNIAALITEKGVVQPVTAERIQAVLNG